MSRAVVGLLAVAAACAGAPAGDDRPAVTAAAPAVVRHAVRIRFEPPLAAPGRLEFAHECGERGVVATTRLGVDLQLPAGPASLVLHADGRRLERPLVVAPDLPPIDWALAPRLRVGAGEGIVDAALERRRSRR